LRREENRRGEIKEREPAINNILFDVKG